MAATASAASADITKEPTTLAAAAATGENEGPIVGQPAEHLEVDEAAEEDNVVFPTGPKVWLTMTVVCIATFLIGLDLTIVAVAIPRLTDEFNTVADIGWYSASYALVASAFVFFFGKLYTIFPTKNIYIFGLTTFEVGSLICTLARSSKAFILGRAILGLGASAMSGGMLKILKDLFPMSKQALMVGIVGGCQCVGLVSAPMVGGLLIDAFTWRGCFGVNLPLGTLCILFALYAFQAPSTGIDTTLSFREKIKRVDLVSTLLIVPSTTCLLLGLQWGGIRFGWSDPRIIVLFVLFAVLFTSFGYYQYRLGEKATIPPRILKHRSILGALWFGACCNGILAVTENYISVYYQGVRGYTPTKSGLLGLPMIAGLTIASFAAATGASVTGYYYPFLFATSILAPIASGLLTTVDLDGSVVKSAALLGFLGIAVGLGLQGPLLAIQASLTSKDVTIGGAVVGFGCGLGSAMWTCVAASLFQSRLETEIHKHSPSTNTTAIETAGLSQIRNVVGPERLKSVLAGYNEAVVQTLYLPLALGLLTIAGSAAIERRSLKKKQE